MKQCERCKEWRSRRHDDTECECKEFTVIDEDGEEHTVFANEEYLAALRYAKTSNEDGDYYLMDSGVEIKVNSSAYVISAEPDIHYSARKLPVKSADIMLEDE